MGPFLIRPAAAQRTARATMINGTGGGGPSAKWLEQLLEPGPDTSQVPVLVALGRNNIGCIMARKGALAQAAAHLQAALAFHQSHSLMARRAGTAAGLPVAQPAGSGRRAAGDAVIATAQPEASGVVPEYCAVRAAPRPRVAHLPSQAPQQQHWHAEAPCVRVSLRASVGPWNGADFAATALRAVHTAVSQAIAHLNLSGVLVLSDSLKDDPRPARAHAEGKNTAAALCVFPLPPWLKTLPLPCVCFRCRPGYNTAFALHSSSRRRAVPGWGGPAAAGAGLPGAAEGAAAGAGGESDRGAPRGGGVLRGTLPPFCVSTPVCRPFVCCRLVGGAPAVLTIVPNCPTCAR